MKKIFLIDDDADDREVFRAALASLEFQATLAEAQDGEHALKMVLDQAFTVPDVIFLDLNMPKMGGLEFLKRTRLIAAYKNVRVLIYSTSSLQKDKDTAEAAGANGFITKHYSFDALCDELASLFRQDLH